MNNFKTAQTNPLHIPIFILSHVIQHIIKKSLTNQLCLNVTVERKWSSHVDSHSCYISLYTYCLTVFKPRIQNITLPSNIILSKYSANDIQFMCNFSKGLTTIFLYTGYSSRKYSNTQLPTMASECGNEVTELAWQNQFAVYIL